jgi:hypothetical protein
VFIFCGSGTRPGSMIILDYFSPVLQETIQQRIDTEP